MTAGGVTVTRSRSRSRSESVPLSRRRLRLGSDSESDPAGRPRRPGRDGVKYYCVRVHPGGRRTRTVLTPSLSNSDAAAVAAAAGIHRADPGGRTDS